MGYTVGLGQNKQNFAASMHDLGPFLLLALAVSWTTLSQQLPSSRRRSENQDLDSTLAWSLPRKVVQTIATAAKYIA